MLTCKILIGTQLVYNFAFAKKFHGNLKNFYSLLKSILHLNFITNGVKTLKADFISLWFENIDFSNIKKYSFAILQNGDKLRRYFKKILQPYTISKIMSRNKLFLVVCVQIESCSTSGSTIGKFRQNKIIQM